MIRSMTGYGCAKAKVAGLTLSLELRSVNNRYLDLNIKLPRGFLFAEATVKSYLQERISRGKVDAFFTIDSAEDERTRISVNKLLASAYRDAIHSIGTELNLSTVVSALDIARLPDVLSLEKEELNQEEILRELKPLVNAAVEDFNGMRVREGEKLRADLERKSERIAGLVEEIEVQAPKTVKAYRDRLESKLREVLSESTLTEDRIVAEAAVFADRVSTDEETVRLNSHLSQFHKLLEEGSPVGRKLDFLIQEFNREANTIGSKCQDSDIAYLVVDLKSEIEKIREQIQNIE